MADRGHPSSADAAPGHLRVVAPFVTDGARFYFQRRSAERARGAAGLLGTFGGKVEPGEDDRDAAARELAEETDLRLPATAFHYLGEYDVESDHRLRTVTVHMVAFLVRLPASGGQFEARDGELVGLDAGDVPGHVAEMSPGTRAGWERYFAGGPPAEQAGGTPG